MFYFQRKEIGIVEKRPVMVKKAWEIPASVPIRVNGVDSGLRPILRQSFMEIRFVFFCVILLLNQPKNNQTQVKT